MEAELKQKINSEAERYKACEEAGRPYEPRIKRKFSNHGRMRIQRLNELPSLTSKEFKDDCNTGNMVRKFTRDIPQLINQDQGMMYGEGIQGITLKTAMNQQIEADQMFNQLPAKIREAFHNSPVELLTFLEDRNNMDRAKELGLIRGEPGLPEGDQFLQVLKEVRDGITAQNAPKEPKTEK